MSAEYRILEVNPKEFIIQVKVVETHGILWWKKTTEEWYRCTIFGHKQYILFLGNRIRPSAPYLKSFKSLKKAKKQVKLFKSKPVLHLDV